MDNVTAKIEGLDELLKALNNIGGIVNDKEIEQALEKESTDLAETIRARAPLGKEGNLRRAITGKLLKRRRDNRRSSFVGVDTRIFGWLYPVEYGHGGSSPAPAHPFFRKAVRSFQFGRHLTPALRKRLMEKWGK